MVSKFIHSVALIALLLLLAPGSVFAQQAEPGTAVVPVDTTETRPIPPAQIADRAIDTADLLRVAAEKSALDGEIQSIRDDFVAKQKQLEELQTETSRRLSEDGPASNLEESEKEWSRVQNRLDGWLRSLSSRAEELGETLAQVRSERALWGLTQESAAANDLPLALTQEIRKTLASIQTVETQVRIARDATLDFQSSVGQAKARTDETLASLREEITRRGKSLIKLDSPPVWNAFSDTGVQGGLSEQFAASWHTNRRSVSTFVDERRYRLLLQLLILLVLVAFFAFLRQKSLVWVQQDRSLESTANLLHYPIAAALIIAVLIGALLDPDAPGGWTAILGCLLLLALLRLLRQALPRSSRSWAYVLALLFLLQWTVKLTPDGNLLSRLALLLLSVTGAAASFWMARPEGLKRSVTSPNWLRTLKSGAWIAGALFVVGAIANIAGSVGFASLLVTGTMRTIFTGLLLWIAATILRAMVRVVMLVPTVRRLNLVSRRGDQVRRASFRLITILAVAGWLVASLTGFMLYRPVIDGLKALFLAEIPIGNVVITPADILIFPLVLWASFKIAHLLCFVLDTDVLPRMTLPRGVPAAVSRLTRYALIVIGVMIAFTAAGFNVDRLTIIFGALGVGIGFGLQNVVNNFVSGLILLFERPVQVGDRIQLDTVEGLVTHIGLRASVIRAVGGAEIVVPNANLISAELVNWTLQDDRRRIELSIGVAYGTDPETVMALLESAAEGVEEISSNPRPEALFMAHGDSSLDFTIRAWAPANQHLRVSSKLRVAMTRALKEAGIVVPFPQRDLHVIR